MVLTPGAVGDDLRDFFHADQIATPIEGAVTVRLAESARIARQRLVDARFDQAPVMSGRRPVGWVATDKRLFELGRGRCMTRLLCVVDAGWAMSSRVGGLAGVS
jgi:hypothetical protein